MDTSELIEEVERASVAFIAALLEQCPQGGFLFGLDDRADAPSVKRWLRRGVAIIKPGESVGERLEAQIEEVALKEQTQRFEGRNLEPLNDRHLETPVDRKCSTFGNVPVARAASQFDCFAPGAQSLDVNLFDE